MFDVTVNKKRDVFLGVFMVIFRYVIAVYLLFLAHEVFAQEKFISAYADVECKAHGQISCGEVYSRFD